MDQPDTERAQRAPSFRSHKEQGKVEPMARTSARKRSRRARAALTIVVILTVIGLTLSNFMFVAGAPATFVVNSTGDATDVSRGDGNCPTSAGVCTLRAAIQEANAHAGRRHDPAPAGVYELEIPTVNDDLETTGDFDIHGSVTIVGAGAGPAIVDGGFPLPGADPRQRGLDRLFEIHPSAGNVTFQRRDAARGLLRRSGRRDPELVVRACCALENGSTCGQPRDRRRRRHQQRRPDRLRVGRRSTRPRRRRVAASRSSTRSSPATAPVAAARRSTTSRSGTIIDPRTATIVDNPGLMIPTRDPQ